MATIVEEKLHTDRIHDRDLLGVGNEKNVTLEEIDELRRLSPEELVLEKKLRRKMDLRIMPLVVLIYLMNYIDR